MIWLWGVVLLVVALGLAFVGVLARSDAEGRGRRLAALLFSMAIVAWLLALALIVVGLA